ncbi:unnamed protein product [Rhizoctonia solani]|uniref:NB-ARC domain-containing protein n=1 Tax=Rhizoctonia solani TaxID=456999 RepID=A0A8H2XBB1_9AGAM|nr:unnamed protein product [Rhizoctonia solani]
MALADSLADGKIQAAEATVSDLSVVARCPAPTPIFTGHKLTIRMIESCILCNTMERKVCIVHGLGSTGKTQVVLRVIEETYDMWKEVVYINASTCESIEATLKSIAIAKKVGNTYKAALQWLESYYEPWLMVLDNVDDPSLPIRDYIPGGKHGSIIITTRLSGMVLLAQGTQSDCNISSMDPDDAMVLLLKSARKQEKLLSEKELESARALLQDMGHLALAVVHAGAFIGQSPHMSMSEYRSQFMVQNQRALEAYSKLPPAVKVNNYGHTVYTAWLMSMVYSAHELKSYYGLLHAYITQGSPLISFDEQS